MLELHHHLKYEKDLLDWFNWFLEFIQTCILVALAIWAMNDLVPFVVKYVEVSV